MSISLSRLDPNGADRPGLIDFFTSNDFPFHVRPERWTVAKVEELIESGAFRSDDNESFWLRHEELGILGLVRLQDLTDDTPMFDLRLATEFRGRGLGVACLQAVTDHVFMTMDVDRFEGNTRDDNFVMPSTFTRAGWSKKAHYRRVWPVSGQTPRDSVAYAMLREEWKSEASVDVHWHDLPMFTPQAWTTRRTLFPTPPNFSSSIVRWAGRHIHRTQSPCTRVCCPRPMSYPLGVMASSSAWHVWSVISVRLCTYRMCSSTQITSAEVSAGSSSPVSSRRLREYGRRSCYGY